MMMVMNNNNNGEEDELDDDEPKMKEKQTLKPAEMKCSLFETRAKDGTLLAASFFKFWTEIKSTFGDQYQHLAEAAETICSLPSTEAECERIFSELKRIVSVQRKNLHWKNVEASCIVECLWKNFSDPSKPPCFTLPRHANRVVDRESCLQILLYQFLKDHNSRCTDAGDDLPLSFKVKDVVAAFLYPKKNQDNFEDGKLKIKVRANAAVADLVPPGASDVKKLEPQARAARMNQAEKDSRCCCGKLLIEHEDLDGKDNWVECVVCENLIHFECTRLTPEGFYVLFEKPAHKRNYTCTKCREEQMRNRRRRREEQRREERQQQAEIVDSDDEDKSSSDDEDHDIFEI